MAGLGEDVLRRSAGRGHRADAAEALVGPGDEDDRAAVARPRRIDRGAGAARQLPRAAAARGDEAFLPKRDQGPVRKLVRDVVDSRRNVASIFLFVAVLMLVAQFTPSLTLKTYTFAAWTGLFLLIVVDSFVLARKIRRSIQERFPDTSPRGHVWYGISRSTMIRRWRFPKADPTVVTHA
jgi:hypothetical protein